LICAQHLAFPRTKVCNRGSNQPDLALAMVYMHNLMFEGLAALEALLADRELDAGSGMLDYTVVRLVIFIVM